MSAEKSFWSVMLSVLIVAACAQSGGRTSGNTRSRVEDDATKEDDSAQEDTCEERALVNGESTADCKSDEGAPPPVQESDAGWRYPATVATEPDSGAESTPPRGAADAGRSAIDDDADQQEDAIVDDDDEERADDDDDDDDDDGDDKDEDVDEDADEQADEDADQDEDQDEAQEEEAEDSDDDADEQRVA